MPSLRDYRERVATLMGPYFIGAAGAGSTTASLEDATWPIKSNLDTSQLYQDQFLFRPAGAIADKTRVVATYAPSTGRLTADLAWGAAPTAAERYELLGIMEPLKIHECINAALKELPIPDDLILTPTADYRRFDLSAIASWLDDENQVRAVGYLTADDDADEVDPYEKPFRGDVRRIGDKLYLFSDTTFDGTETVYLHVLKPAYYHCRAAAGVWGAQSGLALETDEALPSVEWLAWGAVYEAWSRYSRVLDQAGAALLLRDKAEAVTEFTNRIPEYVHLVRRMYRPLASFGPSR